MILILSEQYDSTTTEICRWLRFHGDNFLRINKEDIISDFYLNISNNIIYFTFRVGEIIIDSRSITFYYYRRGEFNFGKKNTIDLFSNDLDKFFEYFLKNDIKDISFIIDVILKLNNTPYFGDYLKNRLNKLEVLYYAKYKCGIEIPNTYITTSSYHLPQDKIMITKGISDNISGESRREVISFGSHNILVDSNKIDFKNIFPSLFQDYINKEIEIRVFFWNTLFFPLAIISQNNEKTKVDFRNYDREKPNRNIPIVLPNDLKRKLKKLLKILDINSGSIDLILEKDSNKYYFLEINPVGQYGGLSTKGNFYIEKLIAKYISNENKKYQK